MTDSAGPVKQISSKTSRLFAVYFCCIINFNTPKFQEENNLYHNVAPSEYYRNGCG
jgi:hypothetical protein